MSGRRVPCWVYPERGELVLLRGGPAYTRVGDMSDPSDWRFPRIVVGGTQRGDPPTFEILDEQGEALNVTHDGEAWDSLEGRFRPRWRTHVREWWKEAQSA